MSVPYSRQYDLSNIQFPSLFHFYELQRDAFWVPAEVDLTDDVKHWRDRLSNDERKFLTYILAFFSQADGLVLENIQTNFSLDVAIPEFKVFYGIQAGIEAIHWDMYHVLLKTLIADKEERKQACNAISHFPCIRKKAEWISKWMTNEKSYAERLVAFACAEGISFSSSFCGIFYFMKKGLLPGVVMSNRFISRDEGMHRDFAVEALKVLKTCEPDFEDESINVIVREARALKNETMYQIIREAVEVEEDFVRESLNCDLIGINADMMMDYVKLVADHLCTSLGLQKIYNVENPFDWMNMIGMTNKQNFFEGRVSEYKKVNDSIKFEFDIDF